MSESMIERVAQAIAKAQTQTESMWQAFLPEASAAIEAMREPTEAMVDAGGDEEVFADGAAYMSLGRVAVEAYQAMIDAALAEHQS